MHRRLKAVAQWEGTHARRTKKINPLNEECERFNCQTRLKTKTNKFSIQFRQIRLGHNAVIVISTSYAKTCARTYDCQKIIRALTRKCFRPALPRSNSFGDHASVKLASTR